MSHIAEDIWARSRTCSGVSVIERLPFLWPDAWRFFAFLASVYSLTRRSQRRGAVLFDDFDSVQDTTIGTITGGFVKGPASGVFRPTKIRESAREARTSTSAPVRRL